LYQARLSKQKAHEDGSWVLTAAEIANPRSGAQALYNLACYQALCSMEIEACDHLRQAVALWPELATQALSDPDFVAIRDKVAAIANHPKSRR
jgi:predicted transcriptional regulator